MYYGLTKQMEPTVCGVVLADEMARNTWIDLRRVRNRAVVGSIDPETRLEFVVALGRFGANNEWEQLSEAGDVVRLGDIGPDALAQAVTDRGEWLTVSIGRDGRASLVATDDPVQGYGIVAVTPKRTVLAHIV